MNWHYDNPIENKQYLCCVKGYSTPVVADWYDNEWGIWITGRGQEWFAFDEHTVICYVGFDEIPMPESW